MQSSTLGRHGLRPFSLEREAMVALKNSCCTHTVTRIVLRTCNIINLNCHAMQLCGIITAQDQVNLRVENMRDH